MSFPHRTDPGTAVLRPRTADAGPGIRPVDGPDPRAPRATPLTRRYEASWLAPDGEVRSSARIAPATPLFEAAFAALARGAVVQTDEGPVAVEDLVPGMRAQTVGGGAETITWIGAMTLYPARMGPDPRAAALVRVTAEAFGLGRPAQDVVLGPYARLCLQGARLQARTRIPSAYIPARAFLDGLGVIELSPASPVTVYHVALARQASLRVMGLEVESFHPGEALAETIDPRMLALYEALFPHLDRLSDFGPMAHPRLTRSEIEAFFG